MNCIPFQYYKSSGHVGTIKQNIIIEPIDALFKSSHVSAKYSQLSPFIKVLILSSAILNLDRK